MVALIEQHTCKEAENILDKALRALYKTDNFTGIIRLSFSEKDWLGYLLECDFLDKNDINVIMFYTGIRGVIT